MAAGPPSRYLGVETPRDGANVDAKDGLSFPDGPRQELDQALAELLTQAERVRITQGRLRALGFSAGAL